MATKKAQFKGEKIRLDKFLASTDIRLSRGAVQRAILQGAVRVNKKITKKNNYTLKKGDKTEIDYQKPKLEADKTVKLIKIYEDSDVLVINKPAGLLVHPIVTQNRQSLAGGLLASVKGIDKVGEDKFRPGIVHRLDADTSGLMIVAKNNPSFKYLKELFRLRKIEKKYLALVHGEIRQKHGVFDLPIGRRTGQSKFRVGFGREAKTAYKRTKVYQKGVDKYTLVDIQLHTGRTHQIRVHFSSADHPVAGDKLYGRRFKKTDVKLFSRQFLHSYYLKLKLPNGKIKEFKIDLPKDLKKILTNLKKI